MNKYFIFTDCHGCLDQLVELLQKSDIKIKNGKIIESPYIKIINLGDYIDKGKQTIEIVDFLYNNQDFILNVIANHEHFVVQYWRNKISNVKPEILNFFNSVKIENKDFRDQLCILYDNSVPFVIGPNFIASHSPCHRCYLTKSDNASLRHQRNYRYIHFSKEKIIKEINSFYNHSIFVKPHCFGHIPIKEPQISRNFIALDTGCVFGNKLTGLILRNSKSKFIQVDGVKYCNGNLITIGE